jgi:TPR repeat protein
MRKAHKLWLRAGELGCTIAYYNAGHAYYNGYGVERDTKKSTHYYELAAMGGHVQGRHNLGVDEDEAGNKKRALKHWMISAGAGDDKSLKAIRACFVNGHATKDDFEKALRAHKEAADEMRSDQRDAATAARSTRK